MNTPRVSAKELKPSLDFVISRASAEDIPDLLNLEEVAFQTDRLSRRSFRHWLKSEQCQFLCAKKDGHLLGYCLFIFHKGTQLARLYSIAVDASCRGLGVARALMAAGEAAVVASGKLYVRLEVSVNNAPAIQLYQSLGYRQFGFYQHYYEDDSDALRMQKPVKRYQGNLSHQAIPWLPQTTEFTCGPASLLMAMKSLSDQIEPSPMEELHIWREATTIFMTTGHGGCHPFGLALAANRRGFKSQIWLNRHTPLFVDGVRNLDKKQVIEAVHYEFLAEVERQQLAIQWSDYNADTLQNMFSHGWIPLILISTYRLDGKKTPHWVVMSGFDDACIYVHDPHPDKLSQTPLDCQYLPIAKSEFNKLSVFGTNRLRTAVFIGRG